MDKSPEEVVHQEVLKEYYKVKKELERLKKREEGIKSVIKNAMLDKNVSEINTDFMDVFCRQTERITYPRMKVEQFVPSDILEKIQQVSRNVILMAKLKK